MALTDRQIKNLRPKSTTYAVSDFGGLSVEVLPSGSVSWRYRYRFHGKAEKVSLGRYPAVSVIAARRRREEYAEMVANGKSPARHKQEERYALANTTTVFDFAERYVTEIVEKNCKDTRHIRRYLDNEIYPHLAEKAIKDVTAADVQDILLGAYGEVGQRQRGERACRLRASAPRKRDAIYNQPLFEGLGTRRSSSEEARWDSAAKI